MEVTHDRENRRFEINLEGQTALLEYRRSGATVVFTHTEVPREFEGKGIAGALVRAGLEWSQAESATVVPQCSFVVTYIRRHPEWAGIVDAAWQARVRR